MWTTLPEVYGIDWFCDKIRERTDGRIDIDLYTTGALVPNSEIWDAVIEGVVEVGNVDMGYYKGKEPLCAALDAPGLFRDIDDLIDLLYNHGYYDFLEDMWADKYGLHVGGGRAQTTELYTNFPLTKMADFEGRKLRSYGILLDFYTMLGAASTYIPSAEIYSALATGVVDGANYGAAGGGRRIGLHEVCKYFIHTPLQITTNEVWLMRLELWDSLPKDLQLIWDLTLVEHLALFSVAYRAHDMQDLAFIQEEAGVEVLYIEPDEQKKMAAVAEELWNQIAGESPLAAEGMARIKDYLRLLGYID